MKWNLQSLSLLLIPHIQQFCDLVQIPALLLLLPPNFEHCAKVIKSSPSWYRSDICESGGGEGTGEG